MATIAPEGSSWHRVLLDMGEEWKKISGGKVALRIYPGGVVGDEEAMLRKMRVGQLQAAAISGLGLTFLDRSFYALHVPMMFASEEEFDYARSKLSPQLEKILEEKGFIVLNWGDAGWVRFFAKDPFTHPSEMKTMKLYLGAGDAILTQLYKEAGFRPVPISIVGPAWWKPSTRFPLPPWHSSGSPSPPTWRTSIGRSFPAPPSSTRGPG